jgi:DNA-binding transcriptional MerR regulator
LNRIYGRRDRARLKLVLMGKRVGFSLTEIKEMLDLYDLRDGQLTQLRVAHRKFREQMSILEQQKKDIDAALDEVKSTIGEIDDLLKAKEATAG